MLAAVTLLGCSGVPYAPGPTLVPSPSPPSATPPRSRIATPPSTGAPSPPTARGVELRGALVARDGQVAALKALVELGELGPVQRGGEDRGTQQMSVDGTATLTNSTDRINVPAASVTLVFQAGYLRSSKACTALRPPEGVSWGRYCWYLVATASPYGRSGELVALQPGEQRILAVTPPARGLGRLRTPKEGAGRVAAALKRPAIVVALTSAVNYNGTQLRGGCNNPPTLVPSGAAPQPTQLTLAQITLVAATTAITCPELQYVGP